MKINEVLQRNYDEPIKWSKLFTDTRATTQDSRGRPIDVLFTETDDGTYDIAFTVGGQITTSGKGGEFEVFGKVMQILREFVQMHQPQQLTFSALESDKIPLYDRLVQKFATTFGYKPYQPMKDRLRQAIHGPKWNRSAKTYFLRKA